ncbi:MAG: NAD-binding protein [Candidatus Hydrogenedentes bacterium]|nr:NAD-binding protein [Candidatus Hydrogenedentota bacterium]
MKHGEGEKMFIAGTQKQGAGLKASKESVLLRAVRWTVLAWRRIFLIPHLPALVLCWLFGWLRRWFAAPVRGTITGIFFFILSVVAAWYFAIYPFVSSYETTSMTRVLDAWDQAYLTLQLIPLGGDWTTDREALTKAPAIPLELNAARFLLPLVAVFSLFIVLFRWLGDAIQLLIMPRRNHTVVCGLGEAGFAYVRNWEGFWKLWDHGPLVVIEKDAKNPHIEACRALGIPVIVGDATDESILWRSRAQRARCIVSLLPSDREDIEATMHVQRYVDKNWRGRFGRWVGGITGLHRLMARANVPRRGPVVIAQIDSPQLARRLDYYDKIARMSNLDVRFHNIYKMMAIQLFLRHPPEHYAGLFNVRQPHFVVYGFGYLGQQVITEGIHLCQFRKALPPKFTIVDSNVEKVEHFLATEFPGIHGHTKTPPPKAAEFAVVACQFKSQAITKTELDRIVGLAETPTQHIVCFDGEEFALSFALSLQSQLYERVNGNAPIFVRARSRRGMAALLDSNRGRPEIPDGIFAFGMVEEAATPDALDSAYIESLAEAIHTCDYLGRNSHSRLPASKEWFSLADVFRRTNRNAAMHLDVKLRAVGRRRIQAGPGVAPEFSEDEVVLLAELEHRRFCASRLAEGWHYGRKRLDAARQHNLLVEYVPELHAEGNEPMLKILPPMLDGRAERVIELQSAMNGASSAGAGSGAGGERMHTVRQALTYFRKSKRYHCAPVLELGIIQLTSDLDIGSYQLPEKWQDLLRGIDGECQGKSVTIHSPCAYLAEQHAAGYLYDCVLGPAPHAKVMPFTGPCQHQIAILLPVPYAAMEFAINRNLAAGSDGSLVDVWKRGLQELVGREEVRYTDMPLRNTTLSGLADETAMATQFRETWAYIQARCECQILLYPEDKPELLHGFSSHLEDCRANGASESMAPPEIPSVEQGWYFPPVNAACRKTWLVPLKHV